MSRSNLRRFGIVLLAVVTATSGLTSPAHAETDTGSIAGHLTDNGVPVVGAEVNVYGDSYGSTTTDAAGFYRVADLAPSAYYQVQFRKDGHPDQLAVGRTGWNDADSVTVTAGAETTVDDSLLPYGTITGRFVDAAGNGIAASVNADSDGGFNTGVWTGDGNFSLPVHLGRYRLTFYVNGSYQYFPGTRDYEQAARIDITAGAVHVANDTLLPTGTVSGRVTGSGGGPVEGVEVSLADPQYGGSGASAYTDGNGDYLIGSAFTGQYKIRFRLPSGVEQWYHQQWRENDATIVTVSAGAVTTADEQLLPTGTVAGRFTDAGGQGIANVEVSLKTPDSGDTNWRAGTDENGDYTITDVQPGSYAVSFTSGEGVDQYAHSKTSFAASDRFTVTANQTTTVDDVRMPFGDLRITAKDALTGAPIQEFDAWAGSYRWTRTDTGTAEFPQLRAGVQRLEVSAADHLPTITQVTINPGRQTVLEVALTPVAKLTTTVTDAVTGVPLAGVCVAAMLPERPVIPEGCNATESDGKVEIAWLKTGKYQLFAYPRNAPGYGAQWVGATGGTGVQAEAKKFGTTAGQTTTVAPIRLDRAGTITGKVTSATGQPVVGGRVQPLNSSFNGGGNDGVTPVGADGRYTIDYLGPYQWPLLFTADGHAPQWSGRTGNRYDAKRIAVTTGAGTTYNYKMVKGTSVTVTVPGVHENTFVVVDNAVTGDDMGAGWNPVDLDAGTTFLVFGPQKVRVRYIAREGGDVWYGGVDRAHATVVKVPATGTKLITYS